MWATLFTHCPFVDIELHQHRESDSGRSLSKQSQYDWNEPDDWMETENGFYPSERLHNISDNPGKSTKTNISMEADKGINPSGSHQIDWDTARDTIKLKDGMKVRRGIDPAKNYMSEQNAPQEEKYFSGKPNTGLNKKNQKLQKSKVPKINSNYRQMGLFCICIRQSTQPHTVHN